METEHLEPARSVIAKIGGAYKAAEITGRHYSRVYRWMYAETRGGTGGIIPHREAMKLLAHAVDNGIDLSASDFMPAREPAQ